MRVVARDWLAAAALLLLAALPAAAQPAALVAFTVRDGAIAAPLTAAPGDAVRGLALAQDRGKGNCITCHVLPLRAEWMGNLGPPLAGVAGRLSAGELRLRLVNSKLVHDQSNMPAYYRVEGLTGVGRRYAGQPILQAQEVEDVLAYLLTLKE